MQDMELQSKGAGRCLRISRYGFGSGSGRVDEQGHDGRRGDQLMQQLQPLRPDLHVQDAHAREVASRPVQAGDKAKRQRVAPTTKRSGSSRLLPLLAVPQGHSRRSRPPTANEVGGQRGQSIVLVVRPAVFDREVLALDIACLFQAPMERGQEGRVLAGRPAVEEPDYRQRRLLRAGGERPRSRAAEKRDELRVVSVERIACAAHWKSGPA